MKSKVLFLSTLLMALPVYAATPYGNAPTSAQTGPLGQPAPQQAQPQADSLDQPPSRSQAQERQNEHAISPNKHGYTDEGGSLKMAPHGGATQSPQYRPVQPQSRPQPSQSSPPAYDPSEPPPEFGADVE